MEFVLPCGDGLSFYWLMKLRLFLYDYIGGRIENEWSGWVWSDLGRRLYISGRRGEYRHIGERFRGDSSCDSQPIAYLNQVPGAVSVVTQFRPCALA
jgi:hypothetical protein